MKGSIAGPFSLHTRQLPPRADWLAESIRFEPEVAFVACITVARLKPEDATASRLSLGEPESPHFIGISQPGLFLPKLGCGV